MENIRVDLNHAPLDGEAVTFKAPCDASEITGLVIYHDGVSKAFTLTDANGNDIGVLDNIFAEGAIVKAILDTDGNKAFVQNPNTNTYLESKFDSKVSKAGDTLAGNVGFSNSDSYLYKTVGTSGTLTVASGAGGSAESGARLVLHQKEHASYPGHFHLQAQDGTATTKLLGYPTGALYWAGRKFQLFNRYSELESDNQSVQLRMMYPAADTNNYRAIRLWNKQYCSDLAAALRLTTVEDGGSVKYYNIFGAHNKPSGSYTGTGANHYIKIGVNGNLLLIKSRYGGFAVISCDGYGLFVATDGTVTLLNGAVCYWNTVANGGYFTLTGDSAVNRSGTAYTWVVI